MDQIINVVFFRKFSKISLFVQLRASLQLTHWGSFFLSIMAKPHKIEQHLKKESLLKFNVKLKPKLSQSQNLSEAKADPKPELIQTQSWSKSKANLKPKLSQSQSFLKVKADPKPELIQIQT